MSGVVKCTWEGRLKGVDDEVPIQVSSQYIQQEITAITISVGNNSANNVIQGSNSVKLTPPTDSCHNLSQSDTYTHSA